jgi:uncharacterized Zn-binding protein involved in type VI secretion
MARRYDIVKGDLTSAGGTVQRGDSHDTLHAREQAYDGDPVWCPVCLTMGRIECAGKRLATKGPDGREAALSDDVCACKCAVKPRLMHSQDASYSGT